MASFKIELPNDLIKSIENFSNNTEKMLGEMTKAGAEAVLVNHNTINNIDISNLEQHLHMTKVYKTPSDDGINTKVMFSGYMVNKQGKNVPVPLVVMAREFGTSKGETKRPFFRKSFKKSQIEEVMEKVQEKYLPKE